MTGHPVKVPPELFTEWLSEALLQHDAKSGTVAAMVADRAAQWGAMEMMHSVCGWLDEPSQKACHLISPLLDRFTAKPPSLKQQALLQLDTLNADLAMHGKGCDLSQIRRALEALPND